MPAVSELADLRRLTDAARAAPSLDVQADAHAETVLSASLGRSGLLLVGEMHGVRQTPRLIAALVELLNIETVALEWPEQLAPTIDSFRTNGMLDDHDLLWLGDGRLTAGHLGLMRNLADRDPAVGWLAFDSWSMPPEVPGESQWTARDHAMARRILNQDAPGHRTLVLAGSAHTPLTRTDNGVPMGDAFARPVISPWTTASTWTKASWFWITPVQQKRMSPIVRTSSCWANPRCSTEQARGRNGYRAHPDATPCPQEPSERPLCSCGSRRMRPASRSRFRMTLLRPARAIAPICCCRAFPRRTDGPPTAAAGLSSWLVAVVDCDSGESAAGVAATDLHAADIVLNGAVE